MRTLPDQEIGVVGGGLFGSAIAWGLARKGVRPLVLDGEDLAHRASRANFALVWAVSYTHLDVYKRQCQGREPRSIAASSMARFISSSRDCTTTMPYAMPSSCLLYTSRCV